MALFLRPLVAPVSPKALMHDCDPIGSLGSDGNINSSICREPQRSPATPPRQAHVLAPSTSPTPSTPADGPRPHASHIKQHHAPSTTPLRRSSTSDEDRSSAIQRPPSRQLGGPCVSWHRCREAAACIGRGLSSGGGSTSQTALMLQCEHWLEAADPKHRYGTNLRPYFEYWLSELREQEQQRHEQQRCEQQQHQQQHWQQQALEHLAQGPALDDGSELLEGRMQGDAHVVVCDACCATDAAAAAEAPYSSRSENAAATGVAAAPYTCRSSADAAGTAPGSGREPMPAALAGWAGEAVSGVQPLHPTADDSQLANSGRHLMRQSIAGSMHSHHTHHHTHHTAGGAGDAGDETDPESLFGMPMRRSHSAPRLKELARGLGDDGAEPKPGTPPPVSEPLRAASVVTARGASSACGGAGAGMTGRVQARASCSGVFSEAVNAAVAAYKRAAGAEGVAGAGGRSLSVVEGTVPRDAAASAAAAPSGEATVPLRRSSASGDALQRSSAPLSPLPLQQQHHPQAQQSRRSAHTHADARFFYWLDEGCGQQLDLSDRGVPRSKLERERVQYLTEAELDRLEVKVDVPRGGLLVYRLSGAVVDTGSEMRLVQGCEEGERAERRQSERRVSKEEQEAAASKKACKYKGRSGGFELDAMVLLGKQDAAAAAVGVPSVMQLQQQQLLPFAASNAAAAATGVPSVVQYAGLQQQQQRQALSPSAAVDVLQEQSFAPATPQQQAHEPVAPAATQRPSTVPPAAASSSASAPAALSEAAVAAPPAAAAAAMPAVAEAPLGAEAMAGAAATGLGTAAADTPRAAAAGAAEAESSGSTVGSKPATSGEASEEGLLHFEAKPSKWIYVLDTSGRLYLHAKHRGSFHHSSFLRGGAVLSAGGIVVREGRIMKLTADSGHYRPNFNNFMGMVQLLKDWGADLSCTKLSAKHIDCPL